METARSGAGAVPWTIVDDHFLLITSHDALRRVTRSWETFTSAVPFRVPIPPDTGGRTVAQLPLESDPPATHEYRRIVEEPFSRRAAARAEPTVSAMTDVLLDAAIVRGELEVIDSFALPLFLRALALVLGQPQSDADEWISWGRTVWQWSDGDRRWLPNERMDAYIETRVDAALVDPGDDYFSVLARGRIGGRPLTRDEMLGLANLTLAGGRDTTVAVIASALHHVAEHPDDLERLAADPDLVGVATEEFLRSFAPIRVLGRVVTEPTELCGRRLAAGDLVGLGYSIASRDPEQFPRPDECVIDRRPNRHLAFGHGPHTCLGAPLARMVISTVLRQVCRRAGSLEILEHQPSDHEIAPGVRVGWPPRRLTLRLTARTGNLGGTR